MPGVHTFYDGSRVLEPLVPILGFDCDKLNLLFCQIASLLLATLYYNHLPPKPDLRNKRLFFPLVAGVCMCYFCYGGAVKHILGLIGTCYLAMRFLPASKIHVVVTVFSLAYLFFIHWFRWYILTEYYIDITGPMMVMVQKTTTLAFSLHDGTSKKTKELNDIQRHEAIRKVPSILEYGAYMLNFQTVLTGPLCFYTDFIKFIDGQNLEFKEKFLSPNPYPSAFRKIVISFFSAVLLFLFSARFPPEILVEQEYLNRTWYVWWSLFFFVIFLQRVQYYYAWTLADAICNLSGFGFNGFTKNGTQKWNLLTNVDIWKVEMSDSFKETLDGWNIMTMYWLRRIAYDRVPKNYRTLSTYLLSAAWHGFFPGYYLTFLTGAIMTTGARTFRRCVRHKFQINSWTIRLYNSITFTATKIALMYTTFPFVTMQLKPGLKLYGRLYFSYHILALSSILFLPKIMRSIRTSSSKLIDSKSE